MMIWKIAEKYISDMRTIHNMPGETQKETLKEDFLEIMASIPEEASDEEIQIILVDSFQKCSECIRVSWMDSQQDFLIYDTYLTFLYGYLDVMYFSEKEVSGDVHRFISRVVAEECMIHKNNAGALYFALEYHAGKEYSIEQELLNESDALSRMEKIQEWYIMAHEVGHWLFYKNTYGNSEIAKEVKHGVRELIYCYLSGEYSKGLDGEYYQEYLDACREEVFGKEFIIEECVCDTFAYSFVFKKGISRGYTVEDIVEALLVLYLNMELFSMVNLTVSDYDTYDVETAIRLIFLKYYVKEFAETEAAYQNMLKRVYLMYAEKIMSRALAFLEIVDEKITNLSCLNEVLEKTREGDSSVIELLRIDL